MFSIVALGQIYIKGENEFEYPSVCECVSMYNTCKAMYITEYVVVRAGGETRCKIHSHLVNLVGSYRGMATQTQSTEISISYVSYTYR